MIKEFAVDPRLVVRSYADLKYVIEKFGFPEGRVISQFPSGWLRAAYQTAKQLHVGKVECARIEEKLKRIPKNVLVPLGRPGGDGSVDWRELASIEHRRQPFDYILATPLIEDCPCVSLDEFEDGHPSLEYSRDRVIRREAAEMADACALLLRTARHIKIIDPYFDFQKPRFAKTFVAFLSKVGNAAIDIHRNDDISRDELKRRAERHLPKVLPERVSVRMYTWPKDEMHNRYLLTDLGGVTFGTGLDEYLPGKVEEDHIVLLGEDVRKNFWARYAGGDLVAEWAKRS